MPTLHIQPGFEFRNDLLTGGDRTAWLDAVGRELESKGLTIKVGEGTAAKDVKTAAELRAAMSELESAASSAGASLQGYVADLMQALDDIVKPTSAIAAGDSFDLTTRSVIATALGLADGTQDNYAAPAATPFGQQSRTRPVGTMNLAGAILQARAAVATPPAAGQIDVALLDNPDGTPKINYISKATFAGTPRVGRDGIEAEIFFEIQGVPKDEMFEILTQGNTLRRLQRPDGADALTLGSFGLDEMKWDAASHRVRESNPFMSVAIERNRGLRQDPASGEWEIQIARDTFVDRNAVHIDVTTGRPTRLLREHGISIRARERIEGPDGLSGRTLLQTKVGSEIDPITGLKMPLKRDIRTDSPDQTTHDNLDRSLETGKPVGFFGSESVDAIAAVHAMLSSKGVLPDAPPHEDVLVIRPLAYKKQVRGRFHYNETPTRNLVEVFRQCGEAKIKAVADAVAASTSLSPAERDELGALAAALLDRSAIVRHAEAGLRALDANVVVDKALIDRLWPDTTITADKVASKQRMVVAEAIKARYDELAEKLDQVFGKIAGTHDGNGDEIASVAQAPSPRDLRDYVRTKLTVQKFMAYAERAPNSGVTVGQAATYMAFLDKTRQELRGPNAAATRDVLEQRGIFWDHLDEDVTVKMFESKLPGIPDSLASVETTAPFIAMFDAMLAGRDKDAFIADFAAYLLADGDDRLSSAPDQAAMVADLRKRLVASDLEITHRQIECAGTMSKALAFDAQRRAYSGVERNNWGNFLINSTDVCDYFDPANGQVMIGDLALRGSPLPLDPSTTLDLRLSMDVQIELAYADPYLKAIDTAVRAIAVPLFMEWAQGQPGSGVDPTTPRTFAAFLDAQLPAELPQPEDPARAQKLAAREKVVADFGAFVAQRFPEVTVDEHLMVSFMRDDRGQPVESFANVTPGIAVDDEPRLKDDLAGAKAVWTKMVEAQRTLAELPGAGMIRIIERAARDAGVTLGADVAWDAATKAKDDHAVDLVVPQ